jgi:pimeloyl-ACP methyl ester carboxylesterase
MAYVRSRDGTRIAFDATGNGNGPPLILVGGGLDDGTENAPLAPRLASAFTVYNYARRGRGDSGDTPPYALVRELDDLAALIADAGAPARLFGASSGGALALEAAAAGLPVAAVAVYEVPYLVAPGDLERWRAYVSDLATALAHDRRGEALALFMRVAGSTDADIERARAAPVWPSLLALAPTLAYDAACLGAGHPPPRLAKVRCPTLVLTGDDPFFHPAAEALADLIPAADRRILPDQGHIADPNALAQVLATFFV